MNTWKTREIKVGHVGVGGDNPIRIQSMTTSNTRDVEKTIEQIIKLADQGCEIARVTVQGKKEAEACEGIKNGLIQRGYDIPLVADIHFYPPAAMLVAEFVDKVRVNPGNYLDKRATFKELSYTDVSYQEEIKKIEEGFSPLVEKCKSRNIAMRIGTNHGSLSDRIMGRYGDTPKGMVESALEFARVCRNLDYHNFLFSMKASNPLVMILAYRLLVAEMMKLGWDYPLHLGVTEAGNGEDGRVKSACGIGALLLEGIGDTIRVSLTEDPWEEIDPCKRLVEVAKNYPKVDRKLDFEDLQRRKVENSPHPDGSVVLYATEEEFLAPQFYDQIGAEFVLGQITKIEGTADVILVDTFTPAMEEKKAFLEKNAIEVIALDSLEDVGYLRQVDQNKRYVILPLLENKIEEGRAFYQWILENYPKMPIILYAKYTLPIKDLVIQASAELGGLLSDGIGEGVCIASDKMDLESRKNLSFSILQASRLRSSKTEFISCPGCGRTLFDLQSVTKRIQEKTGHLPGVKIAVMGCIVNGPGEMADADFGYVGSRPGKIDLYVGKTCVEKNIDFADADEKLVQLIKSHNRWKEPQEA